MQTTKLEIIALVVLSIVLVSVFALSVNMYDDIEANTEEGALAVFAGAVREFLDTNGAVSAFFGFEETEETKDSSNITAEVAAYIERYNEIYADIE